MRPPVRLIDPVSAGVLTGMRSERASAVRSSTKAVGSSLDRAPGSAPMPVCWTCAASAARTAAMRRSSIGRMTNQ